jgi:hypothetical protein
LTSMFRPSGWYWLIKPSRTGCHRMERTSARSLIGRVTVVWTRTMIGLVLGVFGEDLAQMPLVEGQHPVEHLAAERTLSDRIRPWSLWRGVDDVRHALGPSHARTVDDGRKRSAPPTKKPKTKASKSKPNEPAEATSSAATPTSGANRRPSALSSGSVTAWSSPVLLTCQPVGRCCSLPAGGSSVSAGLRKTYSS